ncbi:DUF47 domain-containing protein [Nonomuraea sp. MG754425]|uniref:DUF47 domain-containing protein n=1 Tax=Nonomuraea sp. MG754425 TaxID=2570319 RepID=UPI001F3FEAD4|nr:DUF47 family protein [Nonomuraea sp. MG754425]
MRSLFRDLSGRTDRILTEQIITQLGATAAGVGLATASATGEIDPAAARARMAEVEHEGDEARAALVGQMRRSLTSPIDREDLFRFSRAIDDVLDAVRDFVRELHLYAAPPDPSFVRLLQALSAGIEQLTEAARLLPTRPRAAAEAARGAKKPGVRASYQLAVAEVLAAPLTQDTVKVTLLLTRLDAAGTSLAAAVDTLADGVIKRYQ